MEKRFFGFVGGFIVFVFVAVFALIFGTCALNVTGVGPRKTKQHADAYAVTYLRRFHGWTNPIVDCAGTDTDANGYVTCTAAETVGSRSIQIECASNIYLENTTNCRVPFMRNLTVQQTDNQ